MNETIETWINKAKSKDVMQGLRERINSKLIPINCLPQIDKKMLISEAKVRICRMGSYIFKTGDTDDFIYYLLEGKVELQAPNKKTIFVYGGTKRTMQPLSEKLPREYSAKAVSAVKLFQVNRQLLKSMLPSKKES